MNGLVTLFQEFVGLMDPSILGLLLLSTLLGVIIGALPGLSATMGIALLTRLTYKFPIAYTFAILMGVYVGAIYGGSMSAILLNIPGTASAAATALEGHPLAMQGRAETAIKVTRLASIIGTFIGVMALALIAPPLTSIALKFTSPEYFTLALFGVMICGSIVTSDIPLKGWIGGLIGLLLAQIGMDTIQGASRFDFGLNQLMSGISMVPAMIGFYAIPEVIKAFAGSKEKITVNEMHDRTGERVAVIPLVYSKLRLIVQSALIGIGIDAVLDMVDFDRRLEGTDLVITGEGRIDAQSVRGKVISGVSRRTASRNIPLVAIVGGIGPGAEEAYDSGVTAIFGTDRQAASLSEIMPLAYENYRCTLEDILRLIRAVKA